MTFSEVLGRPGDAAAAVTLVAAPGQQGIELELGARASVNGTRATLRLTASEASAVQAEGGVVSNDTAFLALQQGVVLDLSLNPSVPRAVADALPAAGFTADATPPTVTAFDFDLNAGLLNVTFSEPVNASALVPARLVLLSAASATTPAPNITLASAQVLAAQVGTQAQDVTVVLGTALLDAVKLDTTLALDNSTVFLATLPGAAVDTAGNALVDVPVAAAAAVRSFVPDTTRPVLSAFDVNMTSGNLLLEFSEPVSIASLNISALAVKNGTASASTVATPVTNGTTVSQDGRTVVVQLTAPVLDQIKLAANTAQSSAATFLDAAAALVTDMAGQPALPVTDKPVRSLTPDSIAPRLVAYDVVMQAGLPPLLVTLTFSEPIDTQAVNATAIVFQTNTTRAESAQSYRLQHAAASVVSSQRQRVVAVTVAEEDFVALRDTLSLESLLRTRAATFLRHDAALVTDTIGNRPAAITASDTALAPALHSLDLTPPRLQGFDLDMDSGEVLLRFSEDVNATRLVTEALTLVPSPGANATTDGVQLVPARDVQLAAANASHALIQLSTQTLNSIKLNPGLATSKDTVFMAVLQEFAIADFAGNRMRLVSSADAVAATAFARDATGPQILSFALNMTSGAISLTFDEVVVRASFDATLAQLINSPGAPTATVTLDAQSITQDSFNSTQLTFTLTQAAANQIRAQQALGTALQNTFVRLQPGAIQDTFGNANELSTANATAVTLDTLPTRLVSLDLDMDTGVLNMSFSEPVNVLSVLPSAVTLSDAVNSSNTHVLADTQVVGSGFAQTVALQLGDKDIRDLKLARICLFRDSCTFSSNATMARDAAGLYLPAVSEAPIDGTFVADSTPPFLPDRGFLYFNLNNGTLALSFSEVVNVSSVQPTRIVLQSYFETPEVTYTLTGGSVLSGYHPGPASTAVVIALSDTDANAIKAAQGLCTSRATCFISLSAAFLADGAGNPSEAAAGDSPFAGAQSFVADTTEPGLVSVEVDMDGGELVLEFDETVSAISLQPTLLTLQTAPWAGASAYSANYTLTGGSVTALSTTTLRVTMLTANVQAIKALDLCLDPAAADNCTLSAGAGFIQDTALTPNQALAIAPSSPANVSAITPDTTAPRLSAFNLDIDAGVMLITFNEPVRRESVTVTEMTLQATSASDAESVALSGGSVTLQRASPSDVGARIVRVVLLQSDVVAIRLNTALATSLANTYLSATNNTARDMSQNLMEPVPVSDARQSSVYQADITPAALVSFSLDMAQGTLALTFTDVVDVSTLRVSGLAIFSGSESYALQSSTTNSTDGLIISIELSEEDLLGILRFPNLARSQNSTLITVSATALDDFTGLDVAVVTAEDPKVAALYVPDTQAPQLTSFDLNMTRGDLTLVFSEPVNASTIDLAALQLRASANATAEDTVLSLSGGSTTQSSDDTEITVRLTTDDFLQLQAKRALASNATTTYLAADGAVRDYFGNALLAPVAVPVATYGDDVLEPVLLSFALDLDQRVLAMTFSEPISVDSFSLSRLALVCSRAEFNTSTAPRFVRSDSDLRTDVVVGLPSDLLHSMYETCGPVAANSTFFVSSTQGVVSDDVGNPSSAISSASAFSADLLVLDSSTPSLSRSTLSLDSGLLQMTWSEPLSSSSAVSSCFTLFKPVSGVSLPLLNGTLSVVAGTSSVDFSLSMSDLNDAKAFTAVHGFQNLSVSVCAGAVDDLGGNDNDALDQSISAVYQDVSEPLLLYSTVNLTSGSLRLLLDEVIVTSAVSPALMTLKAHGTALLTLANATLASQHSDFATELELTLDAGVLDALKAAYYVRGARYFIFATTGLAIKDANANALFGSTGSVGSANVSLIVDDFRAPEVVNFSVHTATPSVSLVISEPADASQGINSSAARLVVNTQTEIVLTNASAAVSAGGRLVTLQLSFADAVRLKLALSGRPLDTNQVLLAVESSFLYDLGGQPVQSTVATPIRATELIPDTAAPVLVAFEYNAGIGEIALDFSEPINSSLAHLLHNVNLTSSDSGVSVPLVSASTSVRFGQTRVTIALPRAQHNAVLRTSHFGDSINNTLLAFGPGPVVSDLFGNDLVGSAIGQGQRLHASSVVQDTVSPALESFDLDLSSGTLIASFSEPVQSLTLNSTKFTLHALPQLNSSWASVPLANSIVNGTSPDGTAVVLYLPVSVVDSLKETSGFARNTSTVWLTASFAAVFDFAQQPLERSGGVAANTVTLDSIAPEVVETSLNMTALRLDVIFSEPIAFAQLNFSGVHLCSSLACDDVVIPVFGVAVAASTRRVVIELAPATATALQQNLNIAVTQNTSFVRVDSLFVADLFANPVKPGTIQVTRFAQDRTPPRLLEASVNMDVGIVNMTFSEVVLEADALLQLISLSATTNATQSLRLEGSQLSRTGAVLSATLSPARLDALKADTRTCRSANTCFLVIEAGGVTDAVGNAAPLLQSTEVQDLVADSRGSRLLAFSLDLENSTLILTFDEPMNLTAALLSIKGVNITLATAPHMQQSVQLRQLTTAQIGSVDVLFGYAARQIVLPLNETDVNRIKLAHPLGAAEATTLITLDAGSFEDTRGNPSVAVDRDDQMYAARVLADMTAPVLGEVHLDMNMNSVLLDFDEPVNVTTLDHQKLFVIIGGQLTRVFLTSANPTTNMALSIHANLSQASTFFLKRNAQALLAGRGVLKLDAGAIVDMAGNAIRQSLKPVQVVVSDSVGPRVVSFNVTWSLEAAAIVVAFDEPVNVTSASETFSALLFSNCTESAFDISTAVTSSDTNPSSAAVSVASQLGSEHDSIRVELGAAVAELLKYHSVCLSETNCCLSVPRAFVLDFSGQASQELPETAPLKPDVVVSDTEQPTLVNFVLLDLNTGWLELSFSEPMDIASVNITAVTLEGAAFPGHTSDVIRVGVAENVVLNSYDKYVRVQLSEDDLAIVKTTDSLCVSPATCWLRFATQAITDKSGNTVVALKPSNSVDPDRETPQLIVDSTGPQLTEVQLNFEAGTLDLRFNEPVLADSLDLQQLLLSTSTEPTAQDAASFSFEARGTVISSNSNLRQLSVTMSQDDLVRLKASALDGLCINSATCLVTVGKGLVRDVSDNVNIELNGTNALVPTQFVPDTTPPVLSEAVSIDLGTGVLVLKFSEPVNVTTLNVSSIELANRTALPRATVRLEQPVRGLEYEDEALRTEIRVLLSAVHLEQIATQSQLAVSLSTAFVALDAGAVLDMAGNEFVSSGSPQQFGAFAAAGRVSILEFSLNMDAGTLALHFSGAVDASSLDVSQLFFQNAASTASSALSASRQLTAASDSGTDSPNGFSLTIHLASSDIDYLKATRGFATERNDTFLGASSEALNAIDGQPILAVVRTAALQATSVVGDQTAPVIMNFNVSMEAGTLQVRFSEVVDVATVNVSRLVLAATNSSLGTQPNTTWYRLSGPATAIDVPQDEAIQGVGRVVQITLSLSQMWAVKVRSGLAATRNTTWLHAYDGAVLDMSGNAASGLGIGSLVAPVQASAFAPDITAPSLVEASLNLNTQSLTLSFSEPMRPGTVQQGTLTLSQQSGLGVSLTHALTEAVRFLSENTIAVLALNQLDIDAINSVPGLCRRPSDCLVSAAPGLARDMAGNAIDVVPAFAASAVIRDVTAPSLQSFRLSMTDEILSLEFNEVINTTQVAAALEETGGTSLSAQLMSMNSSVAHQGNTTFVSLAPVAVMDGGLSRIVTVELSEEIVFTLQLAEDIATDAANTWLQLSTASDVVDVAGNGPEPVLLQAAEVEADFNQPEVVSFSIDMATGHLQLFFSEPIRASTVDVAAITLLGSEEAHGASLNLTSEDCEVDAANGLQVMLVFSAQGLNRVKAVRDLFESNSSSLIAFTAALAADMAGNAVAVPSSPLRASNYAADTNQPRLVAFDLNRDKGELTLVFNETVVGSTLNATAITLRATPNDTSGAHQRLGGGALVSSSLSDTRLVIRLTQSDLNALSEKRIALQRERTWLGIDATLVSDRAGESAVPRDAFSGNLLQCRNFTRDSTPPEVTGFSLSMTSGDLVLTFSETVVAASMNASAVVLQSVANTTAHTRAITTTVPSPGGPVTVVTGYEYAFEQVRLGEGSVVVLSPWASPEVTIRLGFDDLEQLRQRRDIATAQNNTFVALAAGACQDASGVPASPVLESRAVVSTALQADSLAPVLVDATIDLSQRNNVTVTLLFSETVDFSTLRTEALTFASSSGGPLANYTLGSEHVKLRQGLGREAAFALAAVDVVALQQRAHLVSSANDTVLSVAWFVVADVEGNTANSNMTFVVRPSALTPDGNGPILEHFELDMDGGLLDLFFDKPVLEGTVSVDSVVVYANGEQGGEPASVGLSRNSSRVVSLVGGNSTGPGSLPTSHVQIALGVSDLNKLKSTPGLAASKNTSGLLMPSNTLEDTFGNPMVPVDQVDGVRARAFGADTTGPALLAFGLDMELGKISLTFDEPVVAASVNASLLQLQDASSGAGAFEPVQLRNGTTPSYVSLDSLLSVELLLAHDVVFAIKAQDTLAKSQATAFLSARQGFATDIEGNAASERGSTVALAASSYRGDETQPALVAFSFSLGPGKLTLTFTEPVDASSFDASKAKIAADGDVPEAAYDMSLSGVPIAVEPHKLLVSLSDALLGALNKDPSVATRADNTVLLADSQGLVQDTSGNAAQPLPAGGVIPFDFEEDRDGPNVAAFTLDMSSGILSLTFDEVVDLTTFDRSGLELLAGANDTDGAVALQP